MASVNKVTLIGRLTKDPEEKATKSGGTLAKFSIAVDRWGTNKDGEKITDFFDCTAFKSGAEYVNKYGKKGRAVYVEGRIEIDVVEGEDGTKRKFVNISCSDVQFTEAAKDSSDPL